MLTNKQIIYANPPSPSINPSLSPSTKPGTFTLHRSSVPSTPGANESNKLLVRTHYLSLDPAMRQWLTAKRSYIAPVEPGSVMRGQAIAQVLWVGSDPTLQARYKRGDWVVAFTGWQEYALLSAGEVTKIEQWQQPGGGGGGGDRPTDSMSILGITGLTAYFGMIDIGRPKPGDTVVISGAAGATGMVAGQIAKILGAKRVIGIAGGKDKCDFLMRELGFDAAVDYKNTATTTGEPILDWKKQLKTLTPEYIDVFFDNVGGEILDVCLGRAARDARFVICGAISQYNSAKPRGPGPLNFMMVISQRITLKGFIVLDYKAHYPKALKDLSTWLAQGKLKRKEHIVKGGLEAAPSGLVSLYQGANLGKMMVEVVPDSEAVGGVRVGVGARL